MDVITSIRTSPQTARRDVHPSPPGNRTRLIAKVVREVATGRRYQDYADLKDALRRRLARLRIPHTPAEFDDAISLVGHSVVLWTPTAPGQRWPQPPADSQPISRQEAATLNRQLRERIAQQLRRAQ